jgi:hypothetical protein
MNALDRLESVLQDLMERPAALLGSKRLHPLKLASVLTKELEGRAIPLLDRIVVPDAYELRISAADWLAFEGARARLEEELAGYLTRLIEERDLTLGAPVTVRLLEDAGLRQGETLVVASFRGPEALPGLDAYPAHNPTVALPLPAMRLPAASPAEPVLRRTATGASLVLLGPGEAPLSRFALDRSLVRIGRRSSNEIALPDTKVSREHARVERIGGRYYLVDVGSTNGVRINGRDARGRTELVPGDLIEIGLQRLRFEL